MEMSREKNKYRPDESEDEIIEEKKESSVKPKKESKRFSGKISQRKLDRELGRGPTKK